MKKIIAAIAVLFSIGAYAGQCDNLYPHQTELVIPDTVELCNSFYVIRFDTTRAANMASIEWVSVKYGKVNRTNDFHPDNRLPHWAKATPSDYKNSGYDKGHMAPAGDASNDTQMSETFLMSNMTPQVPELNQGPWRELETMVRNRVNQSKKETYVITGAIYNTYDTKLVGKTRVPVPEAYFKVIYWPDGPAAYYAVNHKLAQIQPVSIEDIELMLAYKLPR